jgi:hypothetical protein
MCSNSIPKNLFSVKRACLGVVFYHTDFLDFPQ